MAPDRRSCVDQPCLADQIRLQNGACGYCPSYTRKQQDGTCRADLCNFREILMPTGACSLCSLYSKPDSSKRRCNADPCNGMQILREDGTCRDCPPPTTPDSNGRVCVQNGNPVQPRPPIAPTAPKPGLQDSCSTCECGCCGCQYKKEEFLSEQGAAQLTFQEQGSRQYFELTNLNLFGGALNGLSSATSLMVLVLVFFNSI